MTKKRVALRKKRVALRNIVFLLVLVGGLFAFVFQHELVFSRKIQGVLHPVDQSRTATQPPPNRPHQTPISSSPLRANPRLDLPNLHEFTELVNWPDNESFDPLSGEITGGGNFTAAILTLVDSVYPGRTLKLLTMLHSVEVHMNARYPVVLVYDPNQKKIGELKRKVQNCTSLKLIWLAVDVAYSGTLTPTLKKGWPKGQNGGRFGNRDFGYRGMCRLFSGLLMRHPALQHFDYLMRMDDDSRFPLPLGIDLFEQFHQRQPLDFVIRNFYEGQHEQVIELLDLYSSNITHKSTGTNSRDLLTDKLCNMGPTTLYTNFWIARRTLFSDPRSPFFQLLDAILVQFGFLRYGIGDDYFINYAMCKLNRNEKGLPATMELWRFPFAHNMHQECPGSNIQPCKNPHFQGKNYKPLHVWNWQKTCGCRKLGCAMTIGGQCVPAQEVYGGMLPHAIPVSQFPSVVTVALMLDRQPYSTPDKLTEIQRMQLADLPASWFT